MDDDLENDMEEFYENRRIGSEIVSLEGPRLGADREVAPFAYRAKLMGVNGLGQPTSFNRDFIFVESDGQLKLDWRATYGWNVTSLAAFSTQRLTTPTRLMVRCRIDTLTTWPAPGVTDETLNLEIRPFDDPFGDVRARVPKNSPAGKWLLSELSDGEDHDMILTVVYRNGKMDDCCWVTQVSSDRNYLYDDPRFATLTAAVPPTTSPQEVVKLPQLRIFDVQTKFRESRDSDGTTTVRPGVIFTLQSTEREIDALSLRFDLLETKEGGERIVDDGFTSVVTKSSASLKKGMSKVVGWDSAVGYQGGDLVTGSVILNNQLRIVVSASIDGTTYTEIESIPLTLKEIAEDLKGNK